MQAGRFQRESRGKETQRERPKEIKENLWFGDHLSKMSAERDLTP